MIWHAADITTQLVCIGISVCRPLYKDWLNNVVVRLESARNSRRGSKRSGSGGTNNSGFSMIALQTIGGSSVLARAGRKGSQCKDVEDDVVKVERSWRVESNTQSETSRNMVFPGEAASEEHMLGDGDAAVAGTVQGDRRLR